jgi:hypothetical protein
METERQPERQSLESWISGGTLIALVTASAYVWTLAHEAGFCGYFGIPFDFISFNPANVLTVSGINIFAGAFVIFTVSIIFLVVRPLAIYASKSVRRFTVSFILLIIILAHV